MSAHVVLYQFNEASQAWDKKNVEGSLFIVARSSEPKHMFVVLNRLSNEHVVEGITADFQMELTDQFLLYRNEKEEINGIWFYSPNERTEIAELMQSIVAGDAPTASAKGAPDSAADASSSGATSGGPRPPDATSANSEGEGGGGGGNVAAFFSMIQRQLPSAAVPPMPPMPTGATATPSSGVPSAQLAQLALEGMDTNTSLPSGEVGATPETSAGVEALKVELRARLSSLLQDDAFMTTLAEEVLRQKRS